MNIILLGVDCIYLISYTTEILGSLCCWGTEGTTCSNEQNTSLFFISSVTILFHGLTQKSSLALVSKDCVLFALSWICWCSARGPCCSPLCAGQESSCHTTWGNHNMSCSVPALETQREFLKSHETELVLMSSPLVRRCDSWVSHGNGWAASAGSLGTESICGQQWIWVSLVLTLDLSCSEEGSQALRKH